MDSLSISARLSAASSMAVRGAWVEVKAFLARLPVHDLDAQPELAAVYGESLLRTGDPRGAHEWLSPRIATLVRSANRSASRRAVNLTGAAAFEIGVLDEAEARFSEALQMAEREGDHLLIGRATNNLALVASVRGDRGTALSFYALAIPAYQRVGNARGVAETFHNMAITLREEGALDRAEEAEREALAHARDSENPRLASFIQLGRAELMLRRGDAQLAAFAAGRAAESFGRLGDPSFEADGLRIAGIAKERLGDRSAASETLERAVALAIVGGNTRIVAECRVALARHVADSDVTRARVLLSSARDEFARMGARERQQQVESRLVSLGETP